MKENQARLAGWQRLRARQVLVAAQVALSLALLVAAALFARTMVNLRAVDLGFTSSGVLTMSLDPALPRDDGPALASSCGRSGSSGSAPCPVFETPACPC